MIRVKFAKDGQEYKLPAYKNEDDYARAILAAMTGIPLGCLIASDLTDTEMDLIHDAGLALRDTPMWAGRAKPKPKLEVVR